MTVSENRFHLKHTKAVDFLSWAELECLTKALGIPHNVLRNICVKMVPPDADGISVELFGDVYRCKEYAEVMDFSFNVHSYEWNSDAMKVAIYVVTHRGLTFDELYNVRSAYVFYEDSDTKGMKLDEHTLTRCLKMCMRVISSKKMMHRIKHMQDRFEVEGRLQLGEFIELVLWCDLYIAWFDKVKKWELAAGKDKRLMWHLNDFYDFLHHHDSKLKHLLDRQYIKDEWTFNKEKLYINRHLHEPPIMPNLRHKQKSELQQRAYLPIKEALRQSEVDVRRGAAGGYFHEPRPQTAPQFLERQRRETAAKMAAGGGVTAGQRPTRPKSARDLIANYFEGSTTRPRTEVKAEESPPERPRRPHTAPIVRAEEQENLEEKMDAIQFDQSTVGIRYEQFMREDLEFLRPGFWTRAAKRPVPPPPPAPRPRRPAVPARPSAEFLRKIAQQRSKRPLPAHAQSCDARFRGWQPSPDNISRTQQAVLVAPSYEHSNVGQLLDRLHRSDAEVLRKLHGDVVHLRLSHEQRRGIRPMATETSVPTMIPQPSSFAGPGRLEVILAPKAPPPGSRRERLASAKPPEIIKVTKEKEMDRADVDRLRAQLRAGLEARRAERCSVTPAATPLLTITEEP